MDLLRCLDIPPHRILGDVKTEDFGLSGIDIIGNDYDRAAGNKEALEAQMCELLAAGPGDVILDLGCGDGRVLDKLQQRYQQSEFVGIEIDDDLYQKAAARGLHVVHGDAALLCERPEWSEAFSKIHSNLVLQWMKRPGSFLQTFVGMNYVLQEEGEISISLPMRLNGHIEREYRAALQEISSIPDADISKLIPIRDTTLAELRSTLVQTNFVLDSLQIISGNQHQIPSMELWLENFLGPATGLDAGSRKLLFDRMVSRLQSEPSLYNSEKRTWSIEADILIFKAHKVREFSGESSGRLA